MFWYYGKFRQNLRKTHLLVWCVGKTLGSLLCCSHALELERWHHEPLKSLCVRRECSYVSRKLLRTPLSRLKSRVKAVSSPPGTRHLDFHQSVYQFLESKRIYCLYSNILLAASYSYCPFSLPSLATSWLTLSLCFLRSCSCPHRLPLTQPITMSGSICVPHLPQLAHRYVQNLDFLCWEYNLSNA